MSGPIRTAQPRNLVLIAIGVMTLSQFFHYQASYDQQIGVAIGGGGGGDYVQPNLSTGVAIARASNHVNGVSGWSMHPHAWTFLAALAVVFGLNLKLGRAWEAWGYWVAVVGLVCCVFPVDLTLTLPGLGLLAGLVAVAMAIWAARAQAKILKTSAVEPIA
jgi:hypothetical protein